MALKLSRMVPSWAVKLLLCRANSCSTLRVSQHRIGCVVSSRMSSTIAASLIGSHGVLKSKLLGGDFKLQRAGHPPPKSWCVRGTATIPATSNYLIPVGKFELFCVTALTGQHCEFKIFSHHGSKQSRIVSASCLTRVCSVGVDFAVS